MAPLVLEIRILYVALASIVGASMKAARTWKDAAGSQSPWQTAMIHINLVKTSILTWSPSWGGG